MEKENMVHKQTLYISVLIALTLGFMGGAVYTSFKLADKATDTVKPASAPHQDPAGAEARMAAGILELETLLKENPDNADAWIQLGNLFYDSHRFADAIGAYTRSLELKPGNPSVLTDLGVMHRRNNSPEKAVESFDLAIKADPDFETARFNKGVVLMHDLNDLDGALKAWEELVEINPVAEAPGGQLVMDLIQGLKQKAQ